MQARQARLRGNVPRGPLNPDAGTRLHAPRDDLDLPLFPILGDETIRRWLVRRHAVRSIRERVLEPPYILRGDQIRETHRQQLIPRVLRQRDEIVVDVHQTLAVDLEHADPRAV